MVMHTRPCKCMQKEANAVTFQTTPRHHKQPVELCTTRTTWVTLMCVLFNFSYFGFTANTCIKLDVLMALLAVKMKQLWGGVAIGVKTSDTQSTEPVRILSPPFRNFGNFVHPTLPQFTQLYKGSIVFRCVGLYRSTGSIGWSETGTRTGCG